jgi:hypothetical protein
MPSCRPPTADGNNSANKVTPAAIARTSKTPATSQVIADCYLTGSAIVPIASSAKGTQSRPYPAPAIASGVITLVFGYPSPTLAYRWPSGQGTMAANWCVYPRPLRLRQRSSGGCDDWYWSCIHMQQHPHGKNIAVISCFSPRTSWSEVVSRRPRRQSSIPLSCGNDASNALRR